jgi:hypothetical protein
MANKYIIEGATYNGDGTTSSEAASAGAAGAWNHINILTGTAVGYGSLSAGDTVYIRSKTSAGADITFTLSASVTIGSTAATTTDWVTWVLDNGSVWSGIDGVMSFLCPSTYTVTLRAYNEYVAKGADKWLVQETNAAASTKITVIFPNYANITNWYIDLNLGTDANGPSIGLSSSSSAVMTNLRVRSNRRYQQLFTGGSRGIYTLINPIIELTNAAETDPVFAPGDIGAVLQIFGGQIYGAGATTGVAVVRGSASNGFVKLFGTQYPSEMLLMSPVNTFPGLESTGFGVEEGGGVGGVIADRWGYADSRNDGYYPTLNAILPDSGSTGWSWKVYSTLATKTALSNLKIGKFFTGSAATKTITLSLLVSDSLTSANKDSLWVDLIYTDSATGLPSYVTSRDSAAGALDSSTASWTTTTYGAVNLVKKQITLTTPTSVKQDSLISVFLQGYCNAVSAKGIYFVCPDIQLS